MLIDGKVAVIVGGAGGIGKASCKALLLKGAKVGTVNTGGWMDGVSSAII